ncbi:MAG TPA: hypothetical protein VFJ85_11060 [Acidimicrobiales bacterium]|nr:hypothetical protein [Acidimicrobiales bacterium]
MEADTAAATCVDEHLGQLRRPIDAKLGGGDDGDVAEAVDEDVVAPDVAVGRQVPRTARRRRRREERCRQPQGRLLVQRRPGAQRGPWVAVRVHEQVRLRAHPVPFVAAE